MMEWSPMEYEPFHHFKLQTLEVMMKFYLSVIITFFVFHDLALQHMIERLRRIVPSK